MTLNEVERPLSESEWLHICKNDEFVQKYWNNGDVELYDARLKELGRLHNYKVKVTGEP
jgi:hypothetical protein